MVNTKDSKTRSERLSASLKVAALFAVVGFVVLAVETPHWGMSPDMRNAAASTPVPASAAPDTDYFPSRFPAPKGEPEPIAPTF